MTEKRDKGTGDEDRISFEAAEWLVKQDRGFTAKEQDAFFDWLAKDPRHRQWFADHDEMWDGFDGLSEWKPKHSAKPNPDLLAVKGGRLRLVGWPVLAGAAVAAAASLAMALFFWTAEKGDSAWRGNGLLAEGETAASYERHFLSDGSLVELNRGAQVEVRYGEARREVALLEGEAHFSVVKDANRPFLVMARGTVVEAVGTAFNVSLREDEVEVLVAEGRVRMELDAALRDGSSMGEAIDRALDGTELGAGERSIVSLKNGQARATKEAIDERLMEERLSWKIELFDFDATPLSQVVRRFNERNAVQLILRGEEVQSHPVTATFKSNNPQGFVRLLEMTSPVEVEQDERGNYILRMDG